MGIWSPPIRYTFQNYRPTSSSVCPGPWPGLRAMHFQFRRWKGKRARELFRELCLPYVANSADIVYRIEPVQPSIRGAAAVVVVVAGYP